MPLEQQDTANGARGDCAVHASGPGGRNLYYTLTLPRGQYTRVVAAPIVPSESALLRVLPIAMRPRPRAALAAAASAKVERSSAFATKRPRTAT